jgi:cobalt-zinc-cadmium efflux system protein
VRNSGGFLLPLSSQEKVATFDRSAQIRRLWLILGLRSSLFVVELGIGLTSHSLSILAGSGHLFLDLVTLSLTLFALWIVQHRADLDYQKISAWIGLGNGISLGAIAFFIIWKAIEHLQTPETVLGLSMLIGASLNLIVNGSIVYLLQEDSHHDLNLRGVFLHGLADATSAIALLVAAIAVYYFNWLWIDAISSLFVACLIGFNAIMLTRTSFKVLNYRGYTI